MYLGFRIRQCNFQPGVTLRERSCHGTNGFAVRAKNAVFYLVEGKSETSNHVVYGVEKLQRNKQINTKSIDIC